MTRRTYYRRMFYAAAIFNWLVAAMIIAKIVFPAQIPIASPFDPFAGQAFALLIAVFGYGYFLVGRNPERNEAMVQVGVLGKLLIFLLFLSGALGGTLPFALMLPACADVIFAFLFLEFLFVGRRRLSLA